MNIYFYVSCFLPKILPFFLKFHNTLHYTILLVYTNNNSNYTMSFLRVPILLYVLCRSGRKHYIVELGSLVRFSRRKNYRQVLPRSITQEPVLWRSDSCSIANTVIQLHPNRLEADMNFVQITLPIANMSSGKVYADDIIIVLC